MHFMPGGVILKSYDLIHWEIATYVYEVLDNTPGQCLEGSLSIYGKGMWAASLRYHKGIFYVCFVANDTGKTYLYQSKDIMGPWSKQYVDGFYHDCSLLFEEDDRIYIVYGNKEIWLTELKTDLSGPKLGGLHRRIVKDTGNVSLGYEGAHLYKIHGKYYVFFIHWPAEGACRRTQACYVADSLEGDFVGKDVLDDDMGYHNAGVAQGGIVDTPWGEWYSMLFQDHGAVGRIPVLVPIRWEEDFPVFGVEGKVPDQMDIKSTRPDYVYEPLVDKDDFYYLPDQNGKVHLKKIWQWNHTPKEELWSVTEKPGSLRIRSDKISPNVVLAANTLTQRFTGPVSEAIVTVEGSQLNNGDYAGICALQGCYGLIALTKEKGKYYLSMIAKELNKEESIWGSKEGDQLQGKEFARIAIESSIVTLKVRVDFRDNIDKAEFFYFQDNKWRKLGITHNLFFRLDHFTGCRAGLFYYATKHIGGISEFSNFIYLINE
jgi:beta-xylosidase